MASSGPDTTSPLALRRLSFLALLGLAGTAPAAVLPRADVPAPYVAAPFYPTPLGGWADESDPWAAAYAKAVELVGSMTLAEKTNITAGTGFFMGPCVGNTGSAERVGFPQLCLQDGPLGVRATDNITAFPAGITTGATFDKKLMYERGVALGQEFRGKGANMYLGPSVGALGKKPRGGRNWEGFGADPVLQAFAGAETVRGVQDQGVIAVTKHLIGNEQEIQRMYNVFQQGISANIDDRTMHEIYLWPFAEAVHEGTGAIMTAYNAVNGSAASQQSMLINGLLKNELGFQGLVMTDWLAQMSGVAGALAGMDMGMPGDTNIPIVLGTAYFMYELTRAALNGTVPMERVNDMATRVVAAWYKMGQDGPDYPKKPNFSANTRDREGPLYPAAVFSPRGVVNEFVNVQADHAVVAKQVAQDAVTLLKNDGNLLPLRRDAPLKVFGTDAQANPDGINACDNKSCNKGTLGMGWGSGAADYPYLDDPIGSLRRKAADVQYFATDKFPNNTPEPTPADVAVVFISSDAGENSYTVEGNHGDRDASGLAAWHGGDELVRKAAERYSNVVVVAHTVGPLVMESWISLPSVKSVLVAHLPGQEAGDSLTELLFGEASPSGHLPYTIPVSEDDYDPATRIVPDGLGQPQDTFSDGIYVDYRHFQARNITPRYAFGHGLTYTTFNLSGVTATPGAARSPVPPARPAPPTPAVAGLNATIPAAAEAYLPRGFGKVWRYLYSWLEVGEADAAHAVGAAGDKTYAYPAGYATEPKPLARAGGANGGNPALWDRAFTVRAAVANAGAAHAAKASVQLYVQFPAASSARYPTPPLQLRDFAKTAVLAPGGPAETVELRLTRKDLSVWDAELQDWVWPEGRFAFWLGDASDHFYAVCYSDTGACETDVPARGPL